MSVQWISNEALPKVLPQLHSCECLKLRLLTVSADSFLGSTISSLPNLKSAFIASDEDPESIHDAFLDLVKSSHSITKVVLKLAAANPSFLDNVDSLCLINQAFGTALVGLEPSELWTRILYKTRDGSARANFLYR